MVQGSLKAGHGKVSEESWRYRLALAASITSMAFLGGWLGFLAGDRDLPTVTYVAMALTPEVAPGADFRVKYVMRRIRSCEVHVDRFIFDGENIRHVLPSLELNAGLRLGEDQYTVPVRVPESAKPGRARYSVTSSYICNPLQRLWPIVGQQRDIWFDIR